MRDSVYDDSTARLIAALVVAEPAFEPIVDAHFAAYDQVLPHMFMAEVTHWLAAHGPHPSVLNVLDDAVEWDSRDVRGVIHMSFLEQLTARDPGHQRIATSLPPRLRAALITAGGGNA